jgi:hypothetical protein
MKIKKMNLGREADSGTAHSYRQTANDFAFLKQSVFLDNTVFLRCYIFLENGAEKPVLP